MRQMAPADDRRAWRWVLGISLILTLVRVAVLRASPLELYPDEAQYWLWSRELALWSYAALLQEEGRRRLAAAAGFGLALGLAFLSKYAALYAVIGLALHLTFDRTARRVWSPAGAALALGAFALAAAPNLAWN